ncbi:hypothetical protein J45TS6_40390 [Paenibacillus sp. J45TS6]|nr:hypothetical protein J45TS6_40390 [Paenibacillus sp. J45TS6]
MYQIKSLHSLDSPGVLHNQSKVTHSLVFTGVGYFFSEYNANSNALCADLPKYDTSQKV